MARRHPLYLAVYDVTADKERNKLAELLEGFGFRVQKSAFEMRLSPALFARLRRQLTTLKLESGFVLLYRVDERSPREGAGKMPAPSFSETDHAFVI